MFERKMLLILAGTKHLQISAYKDEMDVIINNLVYVSRSYLSLSLNHKNIQYIFNVSMALSSQTAQKGQKMS